MNFLSLLEAKRDGGVLAAKEIQWLVQNIVAEKIPDYQTSSLLMTIFFCGLDHAELRALTLAMRDSGDVLEFPQDSRPLVDKHSTGGVGDKVSLPLAPLLACLGFRVPMISGRGLGITGGTLDKLEAIPGFRTRLSSREIAHLVQKTGCVICGQTERMVPADKKLYALRDVTGTVPSIPLITASILSKKLAESLDALVLDVKFGAAAFMRRRADAKKLAQTMVSLGKECGVKTRALLTNMDAPLGRAAGNWLEIKESIECLEGRGSRRLTGLVIECAAQLLLQTRRSATISKARAQAAACLASSGPRKKWEEMVRAQGGDLRALQKKLARERTAPVVLELKSRSNGFVQSCDARTIGEIVRDLGGGRVTKDDKINFEVGIDAMVEPGSRVRGGDCLARIHAATAREAKDARDRLAGAFEISSRPKEAPRLIVEVIG